MRGLMRTLAMVAVVLLVPAALYAQQATITGVVKDASGAVLPGVSVEAASPALTEKVRSVVTDGTGQSRIVSLPPGTYTVTVSLQGFNTVRREGIQLEGTLTATLTSIFASVRWKKPSPCSVNHPSSTCRAPGDRWSSMAMSFSRFPPRGRTTTCSSSSPASSPATDKSSCGPPCCCSRPTAGSAEDGRLTVDGINTGASRGGAGVSGYIPDMQNTAEIIFTLSGNLGEAETGGPSMTVVPKSGGNSLSGSFFISALNDKMQGNNFDAEQLSVLASPAKSLLLRDYQVSVGGPIKKDRMWYFFNHRRVDFADAQSGIFANKNAGDPTKWTYVPDFSRQGRIDQTRSIYALRLTMQLTPRNKLSVFWDEQPQCSGAAWTGDDGCMSNKEGYIYGGSQNNGFFGAGPNSPETGDYASTHQKVQQVKYTAPATNKLLLEAGFGTYISQWGYSERPGNPTKNLVRVQEQSAQIFDRNGNRVPTSCADCLTVGGNLKYRSSNWPTGYIFAHTWNAAASYVTGAHNMKFGYQGAFHRDDDNLFPTISNDYLTQFTFNTPCTSSPCPTTPIPTGVTIQSGVFTRKVRTEYYAFYAQEQWTKDRLTLQGALRFDRAWSSFPEQQIGPSVTIPNAIVLPPQMGIKGYNDLSPRIGAAYDLFGNGKTALKGNVGRYLHPASNQGRYINANPSELVSTITGRSWTDTNGNFVPDCNLLNGQAQSPATTGSIDTCGAWADQNFGRERPGTRLDDSILSGWGARPYDWQLGISVQQELFPRVSVEVGYFRRWWPIFGAADITDNVLTAPGDYTRFDVIAPTDSRLPNGGSYTVPQHLQHHRGGECARTGQSSDGGERLRVIFALLGWLRRHRNGTSKKRADSARRHGHRTSGVRSVRAARGGAGKRGDQPVLPSDRANDVDRQGARQLHHPAAGRERVRHVLEPSGRPALGKRGVHKCRHDESRESDAWPRPRRDADRNDHGQRPRAEHDLRRPHRPARYPCRQDSPVRTVEDQPQPGHRQRAELERQPRIQPDVWRHVASANDRADGEALPSQRAARLLIACAGSKEQDPAYAAVRAGLAL